MLQAKNGQGELVIPAAFSRNKLKLLKESKQLFYCPVCQERVILRAGLRVTAHFAHQAETNCLSASGEGVYHEKGKYMLYEWLLSQGIHVEIEKFIPEIKQRPDLYFNLLGREIVIEYQCAVISTEEIINRTKGYQQVGIHVIWMIGEKELQRVSGQVIKLNAFTKTMIHQFSSDYPLSLFYFCPLEALLIKFQDISLLSTQRATGKLSIYPYQTINIKNLLHPTKLAREDLLKISMREKRAFRLKPKRRKFGQELAWQQWLYMNRLHTDYLPSYIYLPIQGDFLMKSASWIWQSRIVIDIINPLQIGQSVTVARCHYLIKNHIDKTTNYPLITEKADPILNYLRLLCDLQILKETADEQFQKIKAIEFHPNIEAAVKSDEQLLQKLFGRFVMKQSFDEHV